MTPSVVLLRGTAVNPWELRPWERLRESGAFDVRVVVPPDNQFDLSTLRLPQLPVRTAGDAMPPGAPGRVLLKAVGQRHFGLDDALAGADIVHAAELGYWFSRQAARLKQRLRFRLALTVWETLPFLEAYRNIRTRRYRREVLQATDLFLAVTERARRALSLEGAPDQWIRVCPPGVELERFASGRQPVPSGTRVVLSIGRLVWEKGHQDLLRALALLRQQGIEDVRAVVVGVGPEERRLRGVAKDLQLTDRVEFRGGIPHDEVASAFAAATCLVLASMPTPYWEEQFGMVLAEAMAAHVPIVAAASGAIPEVLQGHGTLFEPGDWVGLADALSKGPLAPEADTRDAPDPSLLELYSSEAAAARLGAAYDELLAR
jgi:glycosyltransferase involved in cell wall biosynthesis